MYLRTDVWSTYSHVPAICSLVSVPVIYFMNPVIVDSNWSTDVTPPVTGILFCSSLLLCLACVSIWCLATDAYAVLAAFGFFVGFITRPTLHH